MGPARLLYLGGGMLSVGMAVIGVILPLLPTVPFLVLAAFCFARSHPEWEQRLLNHPHYGQPLRDWRERQAISRPAKYAAIGAMAAGVVFSSLTIGLPWALISVAVLCTAGPWIWTRAE